MAVNGTKCSSLIWTYDVVPSKIHAGAIPALMVVQNGIIFCTDGFFLRIITFMLRYISKCTIWINDKVI